MQIKQYIINYKLVQGFRVYYSVHYSVLKAFMLMIVVNKFYYYYYYYITKGYIVVGWIKILLLPQSLVWLLGFGANHSLLFIVQYRRHHTEIRQIQ